MQVDSSSRGLLLTAVFSAAVLVAGCVGETGGTYSSSGGPSPSPTPPPAPAPNPTPEPGDATITLSWDSPTTNVDQTCLNDLSGYRISYGVNSRNYAFSEEIAVNAIACVDSGTAPVAGCGNMHVCTYTVRGLGISTWYLSVQAYDAAGNLSNFSNEVVRTLP